MKIIVLTTASPVHPEPYYMGLYGEILKALEGFPNVVTDKPIVNVRDVPRGDLYVVATLTGGVSGLTFRVVSELGKPVVLVAKGEHNALASALSVKSKLESVGVKTAIYPVSDTMSYAKALRDVVETITASEDLKRIRVLEINDNGVVSPGALRFMERIGGVVEAVSYDEVIRDANVGAPGDFVNDIAKTYGVSRVDENLVKIASFTSKVMEIAESKSVQAITIDCFPMILKYGYTPCLALSLINARGLPFICENDFYSLPLMYLTQRLTGYPGWIANPSGFNEDGLARFAHCTIARNLCRECRLIEHFETGKPFGVSGNYIFGRVLVSRLNMDYSVLRIYYGEVYASGLLNQSYCRTQVLIKLLGVNPVEFYEEALGNHHVVSPLVNNIDRKFALASWWLGWRLEKRV